MLENRDPILTIFACCRGSLVQAFITDHGFELVRHLPAVSSRLESEVRAMNRFQGCRGLLCATVTPHGHCTSTAP